MDVVEEEEFEDAEGLKRRRKIRVTKGDRNKKDKFIEEVTHLECSPQFINEVVNPRLAVSAESNARIEKEEEINREFEEWKKQKFGK